MSYTIRHVTIEDLWGVKDFDTDLHNDINVLIGKNGSNKTTFINLIEACLTVNRRLLRQISFKKVVFLLQDERQEESILIVERDKVDGSEVVRYYNAEFGVKTVTIYDEERNRHRSMEDRLNHMQIVGNLKSMINMCWLPISRSDDQEDRRSYEDFRRNMRLSVDDKLIELLKELTVYRLRLLEQTNKYTNELNQKALSLLLYDDETDNSSSFGIDRFESFEPEEIEKALECVFSQTRGKESERIRTHIAKSQEAMRCVRVQRSLTIDQVVALVLINKTMTLMELTNQYREKVDKILKPITVFKGKLQQFIKDKAFDFSEETGQLCITWHDNKRSKMCDSSTLQLHPSLLSSGEKQLLVLLIQTLLQENKPYVFLADEPELSLHIEWQRNIVGAIHEMNPNAQIIVATHSPEVAGQWIQKIIPMESITRYGN